MNKKLKIEKGTKIFILCPANIATGGPELLHQLCFCLREECNLQAYMLYMNTTKIDPVHDAYKNYKNPYVDKIEDDKKNIIITPEVNDYINFVKRNKNIQKVLWWLSVDNYYNSFKGLKKKINRFCLKRNLPNHNFFDKSLNLFDLHLVQSFYAKDHLSKKNIEAIAYLSDYLNTDFLKNIEEQNKKEDIIAYNPKKGFEFTKKIIDSSSGNFKFIPIIDMSREEVINLLKKSKVYIDFGSHPGKDRIPREAAILKCCIITGKRGSANNHLDIEIFDEYKFKDDKKEIKNILSKIEECITMYDEKISDFNNYIEKISFEEEKFKADLIEIFQ